jgi:hypothetical protein
MQRYYVIAVDPSIRTYAAVRYEIERGSPGTGRCYAKPQPATTEEDLMTIDRKQTVFFFDTLADAEHGAKELCQKNGGVHYLICIAQTVYVAPPGEIVTKTFNDKGLVPS